MLKLLPYVPIRFLSYYIYLLSLIYGFSQDMPLAQYGRLDIPLNNTTPTFHPLCKMSKLSTSKKTSCASQGIQALLASFAYGITDLPLPPGEMTTCPPLLGE